MYVSNAIIKANTDDHWLVQVTNDSGSGTMVVDTKIDRIVLAINDLIDSYLRDRYTLPLASVPEILKEIGLELAIYKLNLGRFLPDVPDNLIKIYDKNIALLKDIAKGNILLGETEATPTGSIIGNAKTQKFSDSVLDKF